MHADAAREGFRTFTPDGFSLARRQRFEKAVEGVIACIFPMKLLMRSLEVTVRAKKIPFRLGWKGDVHRGRGGASANVDQRVGQQCTHGLGRRSGPHQKATARRRRKRN